MSLKYTLVHFRSDGRVACGRPRDSRDPSTETWREVTCAPCLKAGLVEVTFDKWTVFAPEQTAESVLLVLEAIGALIARGRQPREVRPVLRRLLTVHLQARLPDDPLLQGLALRRYRATPLQASRGR